MVTAAEPGKHQGVAAGAATSFSSAASCSAPTSGLKAKGGGRFKEQKKCALIPSSLREPSRAEAGISAVLGNGIKCEPQCLTLYVPALDFPELLLLILHRHSEQVLAEAGPVCFAQHKLLWDQVRHCLELHSSRLSSRENE